MVRLLKSISVIHKHNFSLKGKSLSAQHIMFLRCKPPSELITVIMDWLQSWKSLCTLTGTTAVCTMFLKRPTEGSTSSAKEEQRSFQNQQRKKQNICQVRTRRNLHEELVPGCTFQHSSSPQQAQARFNKEEISGWVGTPSGLVSGRVHQLLWQGKLPFS